MKYSIFGGFALAVCICTAARAETLPPPANPPYLLETQIKLQGTDEDNANLGAGGSNNIGLLSAEARLRLTANINDNTLFFWEGRGVGGIGRGGFESSDTGNVSNVNNFLEWRQSYLQFNNLGDQPFSVTAGRQRVRESYGDWWNQDFDAVRLSYDTTLFRGFVLAGQNLFSYNTSEEFRHDNKDIFRTIAEGSWQYHYQQFFETRLMYQDDHSGIGDIGDVEAANDPNNTDGQLAWAGVRAAGKAPSFIDSADKIIYRADLMGVAGHEDFDTTAPAGSSSLVVTGTDGRDVLGWAFDGAVDIPLALAAKPMIHLGYAYGSGDDDSGDGTDNAFRQSGLEGNFSHLGVLSKNVSNYGTVLRPELSNIHILSAGVTMPLFTASDGGIVYRYYRLAEPTTGLSSSGVNNTLNGRDRDLGHGLDLLFNTDLYQNTNQRNGRIQDVYLRSSLGAFRAGSAYGSNEGEVAGRGLVELGFNF
jgi:hypothetical protein